MPERLSPPLLAFGLAVSLTLLGCQAAVPAAVRPAASFGFGPVEAAGPPAARSARALTRNTISQVSASPPPQASAEVVSGAPQAAPELQSSTPAEGKASPASEPIPVREDERAPQIESWNVSWAVEGDETPYQMVFDLTRRPDGILVMEGALKDPDVPNIWSADLLQLVVGRGFLFGPQSGFVAQRFTLEPVSPDRMEGTTALRINYAWHEFPAVALRIAPTSDLE